jgi:hypothetical protein
MRWKLVIDHSMKRVKELAQENSKLIWKFFTTTKPVKTRVSRRRSTRKHVLKKTRAFNSNPLTKVFIRMQRKGSLSRVTKAKTRRYKKTDLISQIYTKLRGFQL